jgi:hypothetical protein
LANAPVARLHGKKLPDDPVTEIQVMLLWKASRTMLALCVLVREGHQRDAQTLLRSLVETVVNAEWILLDESPDARREKVRQFARWAAAQQLKEAEGMRDVFRSDWSNEIDALRAGPLCALDAADVERLKKRSQPYKESLLERCNAVGLAGFYQTVYRIGCAAGHGSDLALYTEERASAGVATVEHHLGPEVAPRVLRAANLVFSHHLRRVAPFLGMDLADVGAPARTRQDGSSTQEVLPGESRRCSEPGVPPADGSGRPVRG